jgi:hypothetical protein
LWVVYWTIFTVYYFLIIQTLVPAPEYISEVPPMIDIEKLLNEETPQEQLHKYIERMDDYQARLVLSFIKTLFNLAD